MAGVCCVKNADGGDGDGFGGVEADDLLLPLLRLLELRVDSLVDFSLALFEHLRVDGFAELAEDLWKSAILHTGRFHACLHRRREVTTPLTTISTHETLNKSRQKRELSSFRESPDAIGSNPRSFNHMCILRHGPPFPPSLPRSVPSLLTATTSIIVHFRQPAYIVCEPSAFARHLVSQSTQTIRDSLLECSVTDNYQTFPSRTFKNHLSRSSLRPIQHSGAKFDPAQVQFSLKTAHTKSGVIAFVLRVLSAGCTAFLSDAFREQLPHNECFFPKTRFTPSRLATSCLQTRHMVHIPIACSISSRHRLAKLILTKAFAGMAAPSNASPASSETLCVCDNGEGRSHSTLSKCLPSRSLFLIFSGLKTYFRCTYCYMIISPIVIRA